MTAWLPLVEGLLRELPGVEGWAAVKMIDGPPHTGDTPRLYCTVGYALEEESAGSFETDPELGDLITELGEVRCELVAVTGDQDVATLRRTVLGLLAALGDRLAADPRLGGSLPYVSSARILVDVLPVVSSEGSAVRSPFSIAYTART